MTMAPTIMTHLMTVLCINISLGPTACDSCTKKFKDDFKIGRGECLGIRYIKVIHFYYHAVEASFYSNVVQCLPVDPATRFRFHFGIGWSLFHSTT